MIEFILGAALVISLVVPAIVFGGLFLYFTHRSGMALRDELEGLMERFVNGKE